MGTSVEIRGISKSYVRNTKVLNPLDLTIASGELFFLLGSSGCGKSTLLKTIGRILTPRSGEILLSGRSVSRWKTGDLARKMAILPQLHRTAGELTVEELTAFGRVPHRGLGMLPGARDREMVERALEMTRMTDLRRRPLQTLSGGERQTDVANQNHVIVCSFLFQLLSIRHCST